MIKLSKIQAEAIARKIVEQVSKNKRAKVKKLEEELKKSEDFQTTLSMVHDILEASKNLQRADNTYTNICISGVYFHSGDSDETIENSVLSLIRPHTTDYSVVFNHQSIVDDLIIMSVESDSINACIEELTAKYSD